MTLEILPTGVKCNLKCTYCYQEPMREAGNFGAALNFVKVKKTLEESHQSFTMFGGEATLTPNHILEDFFRIGLEKHGANGIQTNAVDISDEHLRLFKKYKVHVGVSIDGPAELNSPRCDVETTDRIIRNISAIRANDIAVSLIVTIHRENANRLEKLIDFLEDMEALGISGVNLHNLEVDNLETARHLALNDQLNFLAFKRLYDNWITYKINKLPYSPFNDIKHLLTSKQAAANCVWNACDPLTTPAVQGVTPDGSLANCGRTNKEGIDWLKTDLHGNERYISLFNTPYELGGCKDCQYWFVCKGQCPGTAIDGDWRNRTKDCLFWFNLIHYIASDLDRRGISRLNPAEINSQFMQQDNHGDAPHGDWHGDHTDRIGLRL